MKTLIKYTLLILILFATSCEEFLDEENLSGEDSQTVFRSEVGFESLVNAAYMPLRVWYGKENGWDLTEAGTDLYTWALDNRSRGFCTYQGYFGFQEQERMGAIWRELYKALNTCNLILKYADNVPYENPQILNQRIAEVKFLRAHYLYLIVETWGGVHFATEPTETAIKTANRTPVEVFYEQIFKDLNEALPDLPASSLGADYGRITQPAVEAFLARAYLTQGNNDKALEHATNVINNYDFSLLNSYDDIWDINNMNNSEVIWSVIYSDNPESTTAALRYVDDNGNWVLYGEGGGRGLEQRGGGNQGHLMWEIRYENIQWGMARDLEQGRGFLRWMPTQFFINLFDETVDQRFYGSFKDVFYCNMAAPNWPGEQDENGVVTEPGVIYIGGNPVNVPDEKVGQPLFEIGDTALLITRRAVPSDQKAKINPEDRFYIHPEKGYIILDINDMYNEDGSPNDLINRQFFFPITQKYNDPERLDLATDYSKRNAFVYRISEMYLIAAEASLGTPQAFDYLLELANHRAYDGDGAALLSTYGVTSATDVDIDFILDERARELATEHQRFFDLKRTGKLVERVSTHNTDASPFIKPEFALRFIPQAQIDAVTNKDEFVQNPGYE